MRLATRPLGGSTWNGPSNRQYLLRMLLRDQRPSTTADVTDGAVVYLAGGELRGALLCADDPDGLDQPFDVDPWFVGQVADNLAD